MTESESGQIPEDEPYEPPDEQPKIEAAAVAYGWIKYLADVTGEAAADLAAYIPDEQEMAAYERVRSRVAAFLHYDAGGD